LDQQDVGPSGVATGRGAFNLSSSRSVGDEENPHGWKLHFTGRYLLLVFGVLNGKSLQPYNMG